MGIHISLPQWMRERIVQILSEHPYTGCEDIIREIKKQTVPKGESI